MQITIEQHTDAMEMHHIAVALQRIAAERGYKAPVGVHTSASNATSAVEALADLIDRTGVKVEDVPPVTYSVETVPVNTDHASIDDAGTVSVHVAPPATATGEFLDPIDSLPERTTDSKIDADGLPWDPRIHSSSRERNANGKWRTARRPKSQTEEQWQETLTRVNAELRDLMEIPVSSGAVADATAETTEFPDIVEYDGGVTTETNIQDEILNSIVYVGEPVVVAPPVTIAPPVVAPPITIGEREKEQILANVTPPITADKPAIETFAQLMSWLTSRTPKDEAAKPAMVIRVNEILAANGLTTLQQLGQRADLIPRVLVQFQAAFGE